MPLYHVDQGRVALLSLDGPLTMRGEDAGYDWLVVLAPHEDGALDAAERYDQANAWHSLKLDYRRWGERHPDRYLPRKSLQLGVPVAVVVNDVLRAGKAAVHKDRFWMSGKSANRRAAFKALQRDSRLVIVADGIGPDLIAVAGGGLDVAVAASVLGARRQDSGDWIGPLNER